MLKITKLQEKMPVYDITVENVSNFVANDIVVHNCTEIMLPHDFDHTVVCDLASLNMDRYAEWKRDHDFIADALLFLDVNLEEFIESAKHKIGFKNAVRFAEKSRALGLGVLGWHT